MSVQVTGILKAPLGAILADTVVRVVTEESEFSLPLTEGNFTTGGDGTYDVTLEEGSYRISVLQDPAERTCDTLVLIDGSTPAVLTLAELVKNHTI